MKTAEEKLAKIAEIFNTERGFGGMYPEEEEHKKELIKQDMAFQFAMARALKLGLEQMPVSLFAKRHTMTVQQRDWTIQRNITLRFAGTVLG
jgi:hypothetical protein